MPKVTSIYLTPSVQALLTEATKLGIGGSPAHKLQQLATLGMIRLTNKFPPGVADAPRDLHIIIPQLKAGLAQAKQQADALNVLIGHLTEGIAAAEKEEARLTESLQALLAVAQIPVNLIAPQGPQP